MRSVKIKRASLITKIVILAALIYAAISLLNLQGQIQNAAEEKALLEKQIEEQTQTNASLSDDIAHSGDPDRVADIARKKLGLVSPGEKVFYDVSN
ncbi:cell division protein FtsL [Papillibacter cinnamivorans DSM 12816]|uniref:Cell division protein FtsL n=1 Tax=Papillibacter cinnamivorans DSM 12816 TaxID=1122930 RepID=A0A1W2A2V4_9FIRM|nr:cell division protein FtsL [Papillibacter cinnamivorans DSM 12816]